MTLSIRISQRVWCAGTSLAIALMGCGSTVIEQGGGAGGTTTVSIASTSKSTGALNPTSGSTNPTGGGPMDCQNAADDINAKLKACGITASSTSGSGGAGGSPNSSCTAAQGAAAKAIAKCFTDASCDSLTGKDTAGAAAYANCINAASQTGSAAVSTGAGN